jgi:hypothetical protein
MASRNPYPRVKEQVQAVDQKIDQHKGGRDDKSDRLHSDEVTAIDRLDQQRTDTGQREQIFDNYGAAQQYSDLQANNRD